jgi:uncharacterized membrane protein YbaN (DUF454 family)
VRRYLLFLLGWGSLGLGGLGLLLPLMPSTIFLLLALWAFSKSSPTFHRWLFTHPWLGRSLRAWHTHRAIPRKAKVVAVATMGGSVLYVTLYVATDWLLPVLLSGGLAGIAVYILTRPGHAGPPESPTPPPDA